MVIGLTIVSAGTSLPEVATSLVATLRGERDIAVGNVIGSNVFNLLGVLGLSGLVAPQALAVSPAMLNFDMPVMIGVAVACLPIFFTGHLIARWEGALFLFYYAAYMAYLLLAAQQHDQLDTYRTAMVTVVMPLTAITLAVFMVRHHRARKVTCRP
jgi:cation:H+ antiporter